MRATASQGPELGGSLHRTFEARHRCTARPLTSVVEQVVLDDSKVDAFLAGCSEQFEAILDAVD